MIAELELLDEETLRGFIGGRRWFGSKAREIAHARVVDSTVVRSEVPRLVCAVAEVRFHPGTHELYQLLLGSRPSEDGWDGEVIVERDGWVVYEALADPALARELLHLMRAETTVRADEGSLEFRATDLHAFGADISAPRPAGVEQSNTSVIFGEELIL